MAASKRSIFTILKFLRKRTGPMLWLYSVPTTLFVGGTGTKGLKPHS